MLVFVINTTAAKPVIIHRWPVPPTASPARTIGRNANANVIVCVWDCGTLVDDWFFGIRFETNTNPRSTNVTFGDDSGVNGPFSKDSDRINVGQAYLGYKGFKDVTLTVGRMPNPLVTTPMVWDPDINPEGLAEQWKHTYNFEFGGGEAPAAVESYGKEGGKGIIAPAASEPFKLKLDLFVNFAQFIYDDANPENPLGP